MMSDHVMVFSAIILAAGRSSRMGQPKMNLPWRNTTVLGAVVKGLHAGGIENICIVVNKNRIPLIQDEMKSERIQFVENPDADTSEMLASIQVGLRALHPEVDYVFICLGDQPEIDPKVIEQLKIMALKDSSPLIIPSYKMRRGHPWLVRMDLMDEILRLKEPDTVRTFINKHTDDIKYINIDHELPPDMDTPEDYQHLISRYG